MSNAKSYTTYNRHGQAVKVTIPTGADDRATRDREEREIPDERNARYILATVYARLLVEAASGRLDLNALACDELAARGLDPRTGDWVGFDKARALADEAKAQLGA